MVSMAYTENHTYYITLRRSGEKWEVLYNIGNRGELTTILRLRGRDANRIFEGVIRTLARQGAVIPLRVFNNEQVYAVREDLGPVIGSYLILVRRARNIEKWNKFLSELVSGRYVGVAKAFSMFLELAIELSKSVQVRSSKERYTLSPIVLEALSTSLKQFVSEIVKLYEKQAVNHN